MHGVRLARQSNVARTARIPTVARFVLLAIVTCIAFGNGCGLRTAVRPPEDTAPLIPGVVTATREDSVVVVRWKRAEQSADGQRLDDLASFLIERRSGESGEWTRVATIDVVDQEKIRRRRDFSWRDEQPPSGAVSYHVLAVTADGQVGPATPHAEAVTKASVESLRKESSK